MMGARNVLAWRSATLVALLCLTFGVGCNRKINAKQCDDLVDRYAELEMKVREPHKPDAGSEADELTAEKKAARTDDAFKNCTTEITATEFTCAMKAASAPELLRCLE